MQPIILASQSPRRKQLLEWAEVSFEVITQTTEETFPADIPVIDVPVHIALQKALVVKAYIQQAYHGIHAKQPVLAADTIVVLGNTVIGKPKDRADAIQILTSLAGNHHQVITGVIIITQEKTISFADVTDVEFHPLTQEEIIFYIDTYKPYDKAGAYAIQEWIGVVGIKKIKGDFYNVMGLPISRVVQELKKIDEYGK